MREGISALWGCSKKSQSNLREVYERRSESYKKRSSLREGMQSLLLKGWWWYQPCPSWHNYNINTRTCRFWSQEELLLGIYLHRWVIRQIKVHIVLKGWWHNHIPALLELVEDSFWLLPLGRWLLLMCLWHLGCWQQSMLSGVAMPDLLRSHSLWDFALISPSCSLQSFFFSVASSTGGVNGAAVLQGEFRFALPFRKNHLL